MRFEITHRTGVPRENPRSERSLTRLVLAYHAVTLNEANVDLAARRSLESVRAAMTAGLPPGTVIRAVVIDEHGGMQLGHPEDARTQVGWAAVTPEALERVLGRKADPLGWAGAWLTAAKELAQLTAYARGDDFGFIVVDGQNRVVSQKSGYSFYADAKVAASASMAGLSQHVPAPRPRLSADPISYSRTSPPRSY